MCKWSGWSGVMSAPGGTPGARAPLSLLLSVFSPPHGPVSIGIPFSLGHELSVNAVVP